MTNRIRQLALAQKPARFTGALRRHLVFYAAFIFIVFTSLYWGLLASDRYVSEAHVVVDRTDFSTSTSTMGLASLVTGGSGQDLSLLRDHLTSVDMMEKLDARFNLRAHYSDSQRDPISRMWFADAPREWFYRHYLSRVAIETDEANGVLRVIAQAYTPEMAHSIDSALVEEGGKFLNNMAHHLAGEQVAFLEQEVTRVSERLLAARQAVVEYQNTKGLLSPQSTAESIAAIIASLDGQLVALKTQKETMLGYLNPNVPAVAQINLQIKALEKQLVEEQAKVASSQGQTLNWSVEEFQRLQMQAEFIQDVYRTALTALEKGRVEATRTIKVLSVVQSPTQPQYPLEPKRIYNIIACIISTLLVTGILQLLTAIVRDHQE